MLVRLRHLFLFSQEIVADIIAMADTCTLF